MRLTCPNCDAQYEIDDALVPPQGRDVECSACGQVWFQPGAQAAFQPSFQPSSPPAAFQPSFQPSFQPDSRSGAAQDAASDQQARPLNRQLSASVLSILQDEVDFERRAREADREGTPRSAAGPQERDQPEDRTAADDKDAGEAFDFPLVDWPATTVTGPELAAPQPQDHPHPQAPANHVPPLVLPDAEKLAATLHAPSQPAPAPEPAVAKRLADNVAHRTGGASHDDTWSLPGDTEEEVGDRDLFAPSEPVDLPPDQPYMEIGAGTDTKHSATALPDTTAASANAAPVAAPAPQAPTEEPPAHGPRHFLPATVTEDDIPAGAAGYRTGFAIAVMLMLLAVTFYFLAPRLAGQGEFGARMMEWHQMIDQARFWLRDQIAGLFGAA